MWTGGWTYPEDRYYYGWEEAERPTEPTTDHQIKSLVVDQLKKNPRTADEDLHVDVKRGVVILGGQASSWLAKRAAGDDAWDTPGVADVSNQLEISTAPE